MAALQQRDNSIADIQALLDTFRGKSTTQTSTSSEQVSPEKTNELLRQILAGTGGLAAVSGAQKGAGLYNSSVNRQLTNDLLARASAQTAALSSNKINTTTNKQNPQASVGEALKSIAVGQAISYGKKKLGVDNIISDIGDKAYNAFFAPELPALSGIVSSSSAPLTLADLGGPSALSSLDTEGLFSSGGSAVSSAGAGSGAASSAAIDMGFLDSIGAGSSAVGSSGAGAAAAGGLDAATAAEIGLTSAGEAGVASSAGSASAGGSSALGSVALPLAVAALGFHLVGDHELDFTSVLNSLFSGKN